MNIFKHLLTVYRSNTGNRQYKTIASLYGYAAVGTSLYAILYFVMKFYYLSAFIFGTYILFLIIAYFLSIKRVLLSLILSFINLSILVISSVLFLGIKSNSHYFLFTGIILFLITEALKKRTGFFLAILCLIEYAVLEVVCSSRVHIIEGMEKFVGVIRYVNIFVAFGAIVYSTIIYRNAVIEYEDKLEKLNDENEYIANFDKLTGLPNRRLLYKKLDEIMVSADKNGTSFVIGIMDVDDFKKINDRFGHLCGDKALKNIAKASLKALRKHDIVGRWGGEEFLIILPDADMKDAKQVMERMRAAVAAASVECEEISNITMTVTIGCEQYRAGKNVVEMINKADALLYKGKKSGKNVVVTEE